MLGSFSAGATSDGVYDHERQVCTLLGYTYDKSDEAEPGCQGFTLQAGPGVPATKGTYPVRRDVPAAGVSLGLGPSSTLSLDLPDVALEAAEAHIP